MLGLQNPKILIVDDEPLNIDILSNVLQNDYIVLAATNGSNGLQAAYNAKPDIIILDVCMPNMDGYEVCRQLKENPATREIPIIFCTTQESDDDEAIGLQMGAVDYIHKPFKPNLLAIRIKNHLELHLYKKSLESMVQERTNHLQLLNDEVDQTFKETLFTLAEAAEIRSRETGQHIRRVAHYSYLLAKHYGLPESECETIKLASTMHDIGKLFIPDDILHKNGKLTEEEFDVMKKHSQYGEKILQNSKRELFRVSSIIAATHHEKYDGSGYPQGLKAKDIPIEGRIVAVTDVFDALAHERSYKPAWPMDKIISYFENQQGIHFDPELVWLFFNNIEEFLGIKEKFRD